MVRAHNQEPVRLTAVRWIGDTALEVCGDDPSKKIGWLRQDAFDFDSTLFGQLQDAYGRRETERLVMLWAQAAPFGKAKSKELRAPA